MSSQDRDLESIPNASFYLNSLRRSVGLGGL